MASPVRARRVRTPVSVGSPPILRPVLSSPPVAHLPSLRVLAAGRRVQDRRPGGRAAYFGQPALGLTDHGVMNGAVELHKAARHGIKPIVGWGLPRRRHKADPSVSRTRPQPPDPVEGDRRGLPPPRGCYPPPGSSRPAAREPAVDLELLDRHGTGVIALTGCLASRASASASPTVGSTTHGPTPATSSASSGPTACSSRCRRTRHRAARPGQRGHRPDRRRAGPAARRHGGRALPRARGLPPSHGAALCADEVDGSAAEDDVRDERVLPEVQRRDGAGVRRVAGGSRLDAGDRRALRHRDRARPPAHPALPPRGGRAGLPARAGRGGLPRRCGDPPPAEAIERMEMELAVVNRMGFTRYFLIVGTGRREGQRHRRRPSRGPPPAASSPTACRSPTSTRCATGCSSSAS